MAARKAEAVWQGDLFNGSGSISLGSGSYQGAYSFKSRMEDGAGTNPEELIAGAHAGCYSMALAAMLSEIGFTPNSVTTDAQVHLVKDTEGFKISRVDLRTLADVPGISVEKFMEIAKKAKEGCPVSKALAGTEITLDANLGVIA